MQKRSILDLLKGSEYASAEKQGRCKVCKKNSQRRYVKCKSTWYVRKKILLFNRIFIQPFWSSAGSFFLVFPSRLSVTFDIQIDLKTKHP